MDYSLECSLLEVCGCNVLCACWIGRDLDLVGRNAIQGSFSFEG